jgi:hypothetical protein
MRPRFKTKLHDHYDGVLTSPCDRFSETGRSNQLVKRGGRCKNVVRGAGNIDF